MNRNSNAGLRIALALVGSVFMLAAFVGGVGFLSYRLVEKKNDAREHAAHLSASSTYTYGLTQSPSSTWDTTTTTTTPTVTYQGGIAYNGAGGSNTRTGYTDGEEAKRLALAECNQALWNAGWASDSHCGYVPIRTGECASVATAKAASGWGPTGWASGTNGRSVIIQTALTKCNSMGQGVCYTLTTLCM